MKHQARKRFGQNFLNDAGILHKIVEFISLSTTDRVIEIGPGLGALTRLLLPQAKELIAIEIDRDLISRLEDLFGNEAHFKLINQDVLKFDFATLSGRYRVIGNLPYNISTPLLFHLFTYEALVIDLNIMLQKEVVDRIKAKPSTATYGRLSVMTQYHCDIGKDFLVPATVFKPKPKVDSAFIRLVPHATKPYIAHDYQLFANIVKSAFTLRRKQLKNSLFKYISSEQLQDMNIDISKRPEDVTLEEYVTIANYIYTNNEGNLS